MQLGMVGLGRMGWGMTQRLRRAGHDVVGFDRNPDHRDVGSLPELADRLAAPRAVWVMLPAGAATQTTLEGLESLLAPGDVVIEGGNSFYGESIARGERLESHQIGFIDAGVSGGVWGLDNGFCLMVGGSKPHVDRLRPIFDALAPDRGFVHAGPAGAGHFTKMVHNGIEYGLMQAYAEGYELMSAAELPIDLPGVLDAWRHGSVVRSWLLDLMGLALATDPGLDTVRGYAADSGEGRWTVTEAVRLAVPLPAITASLFARFSSRQDDSPAMKMVAALRQQFGGHAVLPEDARGDSLSDTASG